MKRPDSNSTESTGRVRVEVPVSSELLAAIDAAVQAEGVDRDAFLRNAVSEKIARDAHANTATTRKNRAVVTVPDMRLLRDILDGLENAEHVADGLLFLLVSHLEKGIMSDIQGMVPSHGQVSGM